MGLWRKKPVLGIKGWLPREKKQDWELMDGYGGKKQYWELMKGYTEKRVGQAYEGLYSVRPMKFNR